MTGLPCTPEDFLPPTLPASTDPDPWDLPAERSWLDRAVAKLAVAGPPPFERDARRLELAALDREARAEARMGGVPVEEALDVLSRAALTPAPGRS